MVTTAEKVEGFLQNIRKHNKQINALLHLNDEAAAQAGEVDRKIKQGKAGKLAGKVIAVKSCISVQDMPVTCASRTLENYRGSYDADVVAAIRREDGVIIGMANMDEFACGSSGETSAFGPTRNPAAPDLIPGGSSSGSAAAIAAGFCDMALGTETGGSIRNPASHCGVTGIKPSYGRVSRYGLVDLSMSLDQVGPMAKNVEDTALLLDVISGQSENDGATVAKPVPKLQGERKRKYSVGVIKGFAEMCRDRDIAELVDAAVDKFAAANNAKKGEVELRHVNLAIQTYYPLVYVEFFSGTRKFDGRKYGRKIEDYCGEEVLRRILGGREISRAEHHGRYYRTALKAKRLIAQEIEQAFTQADVLMLPTTPMLPHRLGSKTDPKAMYAYDAFTIPANLAGCCAGAVPVGKVRGVPVGIQVMAPQFREDMLVDVMRLLERQAEPL